MAAKGKKMLEGWRENAAKAGEYLYKIYVNLCPLAASFAFSFRDGRCGN